ncbi:hypothetical protein TSAR_008082 [Trichomalopsis sarcophagae]|uniref:Uncharacterized protein n=1 Tax=Trichomalopsis sarcophagae TaxID=543379 RepID=A0A232FNE5_9HYME|nr:hypothetical protein TSAR_008082 [Trichomalopsis sarcophagae]
MEPAEDEGIVVLKKGFLKDTHNQIDREMEKCSSYQHNVITAARKKLSRPKKVIFLKLQSLVFNRRIHILVILYLIFLLMYVEVLLKMNPTRDNQQLSNTTLNQYQMTNSTRSEASHFTVNLQHQLNEQLDSDQVQSEVKKYQRFKKNRDTE